MLADSSQCQWYHDPTTRIDQWPALTAAGENSDAIDWGVAENATVQSNDGSLGGAGSTGWDAPCHAWLMACQASYEAYRLAKHGYIWLLPPRNCFGCGIDGWWWMMIRQKFNGAATRISSWFDLCFVETTTSIKVVLRAGSSFLVSCRRKFIVLTWGITWW